MKKYLIIFAFLSGHTLAMEPVKILRNKYTFDIPPLCATDIPAFWKKPMVGVAPLSKIALDSLVTFIVEGKDSDAKKNARLALVKRKIIDDLESKPDSDIYKACKQKIIEKYFIYLVAHYFDEKDIIDLPQPYRREEVPSEQVSGCILTPNGSHLLAATTKACLWDMRDCANRAPTPTVFEGDLAPGMTGLHLSEDGLTAFGATSGKIYCWNTVTGKLFRTIELPLLNGKPFKGARFNPQGTLLAGTQVPRSIGIYKLGEALSEIKAVENEMAAVEIAEPMILKDLGVLGGVSWGLPGANTRLLTRINELCFNDAGNRLFYTIFSSRFGISKDVTLSNETECLLIENNLQRQVYRTLPCPNSNFTIVATDGLLLKDFVENKDMQILTFPYIIDNYRMQESIRTIEFSPIMAVIAFLIKQSRKTELLCLFDCFRKQLVPLCISRIEENVYEGPPTQSITFSKDGLLLSIGSSPKPEDQRRDTFKKLLKVISLIKVDTQKLSDLLDQISSLKEVETT